jgi:hypothetical protein
MWQRFQCAQIWPGAANKKRRQSLFGQFTMGATQSGGKDQVGRTGGICWLIGRAMPRTYWERCLAVCLPVKEGALCVSKLMFCRIFCG